MNNILGIVFAAILGTFCYNVYDYLTKLSVWVAIDYILFVIVFALVVDFCNKFLNN
jgi:hypothetical protein